MAGEPEKGEPSRSPPGLFFDHLLNIADFFLDFPSDLFAVPFSLQVRFVERMSDLLFHCAFRFMRSAFNFVFCAAFISFFLLLLHFKTESLSGRLPRGMQ
jgi:hypothetical protein